MDDKTKSKIAGMIDAKKVGGETAVAAAPVAAAPVAAAPAVAPVEPEPMPEAPDVEEPEMTYSQFSAKCKELAGVECSCGYIYESEGQSYFQPVKVSGMEVTKEGEKMKVEKPVAAVPAEIPAEAPAASATAELEQLRAQVAAFQAAEAKRDAEDKTAALAAVGVKVDLADVAAGLVTRAEGQTWKQAAEALATARPSMFEAAKPAPVARAVGKLPAGASAPVVKMQAATTVETYAGMPVEGKNPFSKIQKG